MLILLPSNMANKGTSFVFNPDGASIVKVVVFEGKSETRTRSDLASEWKSLEATYNECYLP